MIEDPCKNCDKKEEDDWGLSCVFWCTQALEYSSYMKGYEEGKNIANKYKEDILKLKGEKKK